MARAAKEKTKVKGFILSVIDGRLSGREFHFEDAATVGRIDDNDVTMVDPGISRKHAKVSGKRGVYLVEDLGSANGTRLNGEVIAGPEVLRDGDYIAVGQATLQFSNLDLDRSGDDTGRLKLSEKQRKKLDHGIMGGSPKEQLLKLWATPRGKLIAVGAGLAFVLLFAGLIRSCGKKKKKKGGAQQELSGYALDYDNYQAQGYMSWSFGYGMYSQNYRDSVTFAYKKPPQRLRVTLEYSAWGIDDPEEVVIKLNNKRVGTVPTTRKFQIRDQIRYEYTYGFVLELPQKLLKAGTNYVTFDNTKNGKKGTEMWEVSYVKLREEAIPTIPDPTKANEHFSKAQRAYDHKKVDPANMQKAKRNYELARDYQEMMKVKPASYAKSVLQIRRINNELNEIFRKAKFDAQRAYRYGDYEKAKQIVRQAMLYFRANQRDPRYIQLQNILNSLGQ